MATVLVGNNTSGTTADFVGASGHTAWKRTAAATGTLAKLNVTLKVANPGFTSVELGIYTDVSGTRPGTLLATASTSSGITGTGTITVDVSASAVTINSGTVYWLAIRGVGEQVDFQGSTSGTYVENTTNQALPATWQSAGNNPGTIDVAIWGEDSGGGGGTTVKQLAQLGVG